MERKIGEIFEYNGEWCQCIEGYNCKDCDLRNIICHRDTEIFPFNRCAGAYREDKKSVIFKKLEKVGEPFYTGFYCSWVQKYKLYENNATGEYPKCHFGADYVLIEIKQNKENMEEKGQCCDNRFEIIAKAKEALLKETNITRDEQEMAVIDNILFRCWQMGWLDKYDDAKHSNSESSGKNLKPFDLEAAKSGKPVCTRDGRKARIICWDRIDSTGCNLPIVALVQCEETEVLQLYHDDGKCDVKADLDLMMLPEKKEGWVNVYKDGLLDTRVYNTKKEAFDKASPRDYVDTVRISWEESE